MAERRKVMVFGTFDGVHEGHRDFFRQAAAHGDVIAVVARDATVVQLKNKKATYSEKERRTLVQKEKDVSYAVLGDEELSVYRVINDEHPDVICIGYDQKELERDLRIWLKDKEEIEVIRLQAYLSDTFHSSLLKK
ncbi:MAG: adenylyltransferase/cytidyltransferase family protein [archaeon]|nr:adenylyltransferase/cytidyltransferase family protein [archaeon]